TDPLELSAKDVEGKNVWIIDDICDTGKTLLHATKLLQLEYEPESIHTAVLVDRIGIPKVFVPSVRGYCYEGKEFLIGCGMGIGEKYRELRYLAAWTGKDSREEEIIAESHAQGAS
ncbi:MAG: phosphoribosyltransferase family protein, partial [Candidatus Hodarchaeales archaeon]